MASHLCDIFEVCTGISLQILSHAIEQYNIVGTVKGSEDLGFDHSLSINFL